MTNDILATLDSRGYALIGGAIFTACVVEVCYIINLAVAAWVLS